jgi:hypothetical protein
MYHRTLKELTLLQTRREKQAQDPNHNPRPCPFLPKEEPPTTPETPDHDDDDTDTDDKMQNAQNEPTEVPHPAAATPPASQSPASSRSSILQNEPTGLLLNRPPLQTPNG